MLYCIRCYKYKPDSEMKSKKRCHLCAAKLHLYYKINNNKIIEKSKVYYKNNVEKKKQYNRKYYENNKKEIINNVMLYAENRKKTDPVFKLRKRISGDIWKALKTNKSSKTGHSILKFLNCTIQDLKEHLEKQFEPWMNWKNWGIYNKNTWNDNDSATWIWQIDHIIPHSTFKYISMDSKEFKDCWALSNLRPLSAKQNIKKGKKY